MEGILSKCIDIFRFVNEKDTFERYYKQHLAKRLLTGKFQSEDLEKNVITKLKTECGQQFTKKLEGMFHDVQLSRELSLEFKSTLEAMPDVFVHTLTYTNWPIPPPSFSCTLPEPCQTLTGRYETFYRQKYSGRRLTWLPHMGTVDMRVSFDKGKKEINMSTFAMMVLVSAFETLPDQSWITLSDIQSKTDLPLLELKRTLQSLSLGKHKILLKRGKGKDMSLAEEFAFNAAFTCSLSKIKILSIASTTHRVETDQEREETLARVQEGRRLQIEAAIVRIMKARKTLDHTALVTQVMTQLSSRFQPVPAVIKKQIEGLIEREYLERDATCRTLYHYLA